MYGTKCRWHGAWRVLAYNRQAFGGRIKEWQKKNVQIYLDLCRRKSTATYREKRDIHNWKVLLDETTRIILLDDVHPIEWKNMTRFGKKKHWTHHPKFKSDKTTNALHLVLRPDMKFVMLFLHSLRCCQFCYVPETGDKKNEW